MNSWLNVKENITPKTPNICNSVPVGMEGTWQNGWQQHSNYKFLVNSEWTHIWKNSIEIHFSRFPFDWYFYEDPDNAFNEQTLSVTPRILRRKIQISFSMKTVLGKCTVARPNSNWTNWKTIPFNLRPQKCMQIGSTVANFYCNNLII